MKCKMLMLASATVISGNLIAQESNLDSVLQKELNEFSLSTTKVDNAVEVGKIYAPLKSIPITFNSVNQEVIMQKNDLDLGASVKNVTGIRPINRYGGFQTFRIRGFNNFVLLNDGVRDERHNLSTSAPSTNVANIERIEVLKGPSSVLYGHSALGGVINLIRKKPTSELKGGFLASFGSFNTYELSAGVGGPLNKKVNYRIDFSTTKTDGWRDYGVVNNNVTLTFDYNISVRDKLSFSVQANKDKYDTDTGIPVLEGGKLAPGMDPETRYNDPQDFLIHERIDLQAKYTHEFSNDLKLTNQLSWSVDNIDYLSTEFLEFNATLDSLKRSFPFYFNHKTQPIQNQLELNYSWKTGSVEHKTLVGHSISFLDRRTYYGDVLGEGAFTTVSVKDPILNQGNIYHKDNSVRAKEEFVNGFYLQNWIDFSSKFKALLGVRFDLFSGNYYTNELDEDRNTVKEGEQTKIPSGALTYRGGLVYEPMNDVSLFVGYSNYFKPTRTITETGEIFDPETGFQTEAGIKFIKSDVLIATGSVFYILKNNIVEKTTANVYRQIGEADSRGFELDFNTSAVKGFYFQAGYAFVEAKIRKFADESEVNSLEGNYLQYAPKHMVQSWLNYKVENGLLSGFGAGIGLQYVGDNYTNSSNTYTLPAYEVLDGTIFYQSKNITLRLNINNIADKFYYSDAIYGNQFFVGKGRNYKLSFGLKI